MDTVRMRTRSQVPEEEKLSAATKKPKIYAEDLPFITYKGSINYYTSLINCAMACDQILKLVEDSTEQPFVLGFDMEWPFSFQTGPGSTALIQISPSLTDCYLFHVSELKKLPAALTVLLAHPKVCLTGVNIKNDIRKLGRDFKIDVDAMINNCLDLSVLANTILPITQRWSMARLVEYVLEMQINKDKKVRNSKWHIQPLSNEQKVYAAIDAYASLKLYNDLKEREAKQQDEENKDVANLNNR